MALTDGQKITILVVLILVLGYFIYRKCDTTSGKTVEAMTNVNNDNDSYDTGSTDSTSNNSGSTNSTDSESGSTVDSTQVVIKRGKNANTSGTYKNMSYAENDRGGAGDIDRFFMDCDIDNAADNKDFNPADNVSDKYAAYVAKKTDEGLLPVEEKDWFEDVTPTRIKNRHLINIYRPVGVNTIATSLKNASLDIRGCPANPKTVVSPFLNSSIEPDHNIKGLCN